MSSSLRSNLIDALPEEVVFSLLHDFLRGSLLRLRLVSRQWDRAVLRTLGLHGVLRVERIPMTISSNYHGRVSLNPVSISSDKGPIILDILRQDDRITSIDISPDSFFNGIADFGQAIFDILLHNTSLKALKMSSVRISCAVAKAMSKTLSLNGTLTRLDFFQNRMDTADVVALGQALAVNSSLTELSLRYNNIKGEGMLALCDALRSNNVLTVLRLWNNFVGSNGVRLLSGVLASNSTLNTIHIINSCIAN